MFLASPFASTARISLPLLLLLSLAAGAHAQGDIGLCSDYGGNLCQGRCGSGWSCRTPYGGTQYFSCQPCTCTPATCQAGDCGSKADGCGGTLNCGACCSPATCGAGDCGSKADGCGGTLNCGACSYCGDGTCQEHCSSCPQDCGTCNGSGGSLGLCSAMPTNPCQGRCGPWTCDAGGGQTGTINCPACPCTPLTCKPGDCGTKANGCGGTIDCGCCPTSCGPGDCGTKPNGCGDTIDCGACPYCGDGTCQEQEHCSACPQDCGTCNGSGGSLGLCSLSNPCRGRCGPWTCEDGSGHAGSINCPACPCTPLTCQPGECGGKWNGCNATIECGGCPGGSFCSGSRCVEIPPPCGQGGPCSPCENECSQPSAGCRTYCLLQPPSPYPAPVVATCQAYASLYPAKPNACVTCLPDSVCSMASPQASLNCATHGGVFEVTCDDERNVAASYVCQDGWRCTLTCDGRTHQVSPDPVCGFLCTSGSTAVCQPPLETCETCPQDCGQCPVGDDELSVLTYNVQFLPFDWGFNHSNPQRAVLIGKSPILKNYDVIVFEEAFDDRPRQVLKSLLEPEYPYQTRVLGADWSLLDLKVTNGGVFIASRWPILAVNETVYWACHDVIDCVAAKGVLYARIDKRGQVHHVYGTHTDADLGGDHAADRHARNLQLQQMRQFVNSTNPSPASCSIESACPRGEPHCPQPSCIPRAELMAGDFNIKRGSDEYAAMLATLRAVAPEASGFSPGTNQDGDWIDYVLYSKTTLLHAVPEPSGSGNEVIRCSDPGCLFGGYAPCPDLSDHHPLVGRFSFPAWNGSALEQATSPGAALTSAPSADVATAAQACDVPPALAPPQPSGPSGSVETNVQTFAWTAVAGADRYRLQVADEATNATVLDVTIPEESFTSEPLAVPGRPYRWSVKALRGPEEGPASPELEFTYVETAIPAPVPIGPSGAVQGEYPTFSWSAVPGATRYELEVVDAVTGEGVLAGLVPHTPSIMAWKGLGVDRGYRWTVTALRGTRRGPKSPPAEFSVAGASGLSSPESVGPMGPVEGGVPTFSWNAVSGADSYLLTIATDTQTVETAVVGTSYLPPSDLPTGAYRWDVRAVRANMAGPPSVTLFFHRLAPNRRPAVSVAGCGGECTAPCAGLVVAHAADPDGDQLRYSWSGCAKGDLPTASCTIEAGGPATATVTVTDGRGGAATASFTFLDKVALGVARSGDGAGTTYSTPQGIECRSACQASFLRGTTVSLTAVAVAGSEFAGWAGACTGTGACAVAMDEAKSVTARFVVSRATLTVAKSGSGTGTVSSSPAGINCGSACSASFTSRTLVTLTATVAGPHSSFFGWSGACTGTGACQLTMRGAKSVTATFNAANRPPTVGVSVSRSTCHPTPTTPCTATCTASSSDPDGDPLSYSWSGCAGGSGPTAQCMVPALTTQTCSVSVSDGYGASATASAGVTGVNSPPMCIVNGGSSYDAWNFYWTDHIPLSISDPDGDVIPGCSLSSDASQRLSIGSYQRCLTAPPWIQFRPVCRNMPTTANVVVTISDGWTTSTCGMMTFCYAE